MDEVEGWLVGESKSIRGSVEAIEVWASGLGGR